MRCNVSPLSYLDISSIGVSDPTDFLAANHLVNSSSYGATGWAKARPGRPGADLAQFIAEFRDVPRTLKATANFFQDSWKAAMNGVHKSAEHAANSWLAANFGWLPFLSDLRKFANTYTNVNDRIKDLRKHNNRWIKRSRDVAATTAVLSDTTYPVGSHNPTSFGYYTYYFCKGYGSPGTGSRITVTTNAKFRFVGRFKYWIPNIDSDRWEARARQKLFGLNVNPALVWELTPFSWLVDWASNVGDVFSNMDDNLAENLVASYAYIMGTQTVNVNISSYMTNLNTPSNGFWTQSLSIKDRKQASPFGFALTGIDFNARQWSLISACGLQRLKFGY